VTKLETNHQQASETGEICRLVPAGAQGGRPRGDGDDEGAVHEPLGRLLVAVRPAHHRAGRHQPRRGRRPGHPAPHALPALCRPACMRNLALRSVFFCGKIDWSTFQDKLQRNNILEVILKNENVRA